MNEYYDNDRLNQQPDRVAQQAVKRTTLPQEESAPVRRRRSDRREDAAAQEEAPQWVRRQPPESPAYDGHAFARRTAQLEDEEDWEDEETGKPWLRALLVMLAIALALCAALYFLPDLGPLAGAQQSLRQAVLSVRDTILPVEPKINSFQIITNTGSTGERIYMQITASRSVKNVRLEDIEGHEISSTVSRVNNGDTDTQLFGVSVIFDEPFEGEAFAAFSDGEAWSRSSEWVMLAVSDPTPLPEMTETPLPQPTDVPAVLAPTETPAAEEDSPDTQSLNDSMLPLELPVATWSASGAQSAQEEQPTQEPTLEPQTPVPTQEPTMEPTQEPTAEPTQEPTPEPTAVPTAVPTATPMPRLAAQAADGLDADSMNVTDTVFIGGKTQKNYEREEGYVAPNPDAYSYYAGGVFTFRGDNFRRNAAFGTVEVEDESLSVLWKTELGSLRTADNGTLYGVGWTGQPAIVKWTSEVRQMMNLYEEKKNTKALREVIFGAQDGKIYFLDLTDGSATRDPISVGYPLKGSVSVDTYGRPLIAVGQGISKLASGKTGSIGLHVYNLINGKEEFLLNGRKSDDQKQYSTNGAFDGTALFLYENDAMVVAGENGLLYTIDLGSKFTYPNADDPDATGSMDVKKSVTYLRTKGDGEKETLVSVESSVAMYDKYIYMADTYGLLQCVDSDTMKTVWAADMGDNTDAAIALDMEGDSAVSLYTGNTAYSRLGSKKDVSIRKLNALTGETIWEYNIKCQKNSDQLSGCKASPVIGENSIDDLVVFTVNMLEEGGSRIIALRKASGEVAWSFDMDSNAVSSPVAVYNEAGKAWIIQGDEGGNLYLLDGQTGSLRNTLNLGGKIQGSPAVYKDILVIGTCSKDNACMYGVKIQ